MNERESIGFRVDCEWVCNFVRQRYWYEGMGYDWAMKTLIASFCIPENLIPIYKKEFHLILTGSKKLVGINSGELVDDNKEEEYAKFLERETTRINKLQLEMDIQKNPMKYTDRFSLREIYDDVLEEKGIRLFRELYFTEDEFDIKKFLVKNRDDGFDMTRSFCLGGYWPIQYGIVYDLIDHKIESAEDEIEYQEKLDKFILNIREKWIKDEHLDIFDFFGHEAALYNGLERMEVLRELSRRQKLRDRILAKDKKTRIEEDDEERKPFDGSRDFCKYVLENEKLKPDDLIAPLGLISPDGDWYSCTFASHESLAHAICHQKGMTDEMTWLGCLSKLFELGWIAIRNVTLSGPYVDFGEKYDSEDDLPQSMLNTLYDWKLKYEVYPRKTNRGYF